MPSKKKKASRKLIEQYTDIIVRVDHYDVRVSASINHDAQSPQYAYMLDEEAPVYQFDAHLDIYGTTAAPNEREGDEYHLSLYGDRNPSSGVSLPLKAIQERDGYGVPKYRTYRGRTIPVYREISGLALINKVRGEPRWTVWMPALPRFVSDVLVLLGQGRQTYLSLYERKTERRRWLQHLTVQTNDPRED